MLNLNMNNNKFFFLIIYFCVLTLMCSANAVRVCNIEHDYSISIWLHAAISRYCFDKCKAINTKLSMHICTHPCYT